jgi:hypothetical protein
MKEFAYRKHLATRRVRMATHIRIKTAETGVGVAIRVTAFSPDFFVCRFLAS